MTEKKVITEYRKIPQHMGYRKKDRNFFINYFNCIVTKNGQVLFSAFNYNDEFARPLLSDYISVNYTKRKNKEIFYTTDGEPFQKQVELKIRQLHNETLPLRKSQSNEEELIKKRWKTAKTPLFEEKEKFLKEHGYDTACYYDIPSKARQYLSRNKKVAPAIHSNETFIKMCSELDDLWDKYMIKDVNENWNKYVKKLCKYDGFVRDKCQCLRCLRRVTVPESDESFLCVCGLESFVGRSLGGLVKNG